MKKSVLLICTVLLTVSFIYADLMQPVNPLTAREQSTTPIIRESNREDEIPDYVFNVDPITIMASWYDYFPGSYESIPIRVQPSPAGAHPGGGIYIAFQAIPSAGATRRVYYTYIEDGEITSGPALIDLGGASSEGFPGIDVDPVTGDPFVSWHTASPTNPAFFHCPITFDQYSLMGFPGFWNLPYTVIDNPYVIGDEVDQEFIWPSVFIGPSPNEGQRRVYVVGKNYVQNLAGFPCENSLIAFADFSDPTDLSTYDENQWTIVTIPQLDDWRQEDMRPFRATVVDKGSGRIAIVGHVIQLDSEEAFLPEEVLFVLENDNYGEGAWDLYEGDSYIPVINPDDYWPPDDGEPFEDLRYTPYVNRHNTIIDELGNYHFVAVFSLSTEEQTWYPYMTTTKHIKFHRDTHEFTITDLWPRHEDGVSRYLPWSVPPEYDANGNMITQASWPYYFYGTDEVFHENYHRMIQHENKLVALFQESTKAKLFHDGEADYAPYANVPETHIQISGDYGETWSESIVLNSIDTPELSGMIPAYWYIADHMEHLYDKWWRIHLLFYSQVEYGSFIQGIGGNTGGDIMYTSIDINFEGINVDDQPVAVAPAQLLRQNYPNPFNPTTTISYNLPAAEHVRLDVYNIRGQLVKTLVDGYRPAGENFVVWNGDNNSGRNVGSGVYFYRLSTDSHTETRKMLLVK